MQFRTIVDKKPIVLSVPVAYDLTADVLVIGLGTAGSMAMLQAAKEGLSVIGIEYLFDIGGQGGTGCIWDYFYGCDGGIQNEVARACDSLLQTDYYVSSQRIGLKEQSFPGYVRGAVVEAQALAYGVQLLYQTTVTGVYVKKNKIQGVMAIKDEKPFHIASKVVIDCTGEACIAYLAHCPMLPARLSDGSYQYYSKAQSLLLNSEYVMGSWGSCGRRGVYDQGQGYAALHALKHPFELAHMSKEDHAVYAAPILGVREGRRIDSLENLDFEAILRGDETREPICYASSYVDSFNHDFALDDEASQDYAICGLRYAILSVPVPMKALIPKNLDGLLVAGRCIGVCHNLSGSVRMKRDMEKLGEAAAIVASVSIKRQISIRDVVYKEVEERLRASGCLQEKHRHGWLRCTRWTEPDKDKQPMIFPRSDEEFIALLRGNAPETALFLSKQNPKRWENSLLKCLEEKEQRLKERAALGLAFHKNSCALDTLRKIVQRAVHQRGCEEHTWKALCLLSRYAMREDVALYEKIITLFAEKLACNQIDDELVYAFLQVEVACVGLHRIFPQACERPLKMMLKILHKDCREITVNQGAINLLPTMKELLVFA